MAGPLRGGGGEGPAINEKRTFLDLHFFNFVAIKNKNYFTKDNLSKYGHITLKFIGRYFYWVVTILVQNWGKKKTPPPFGFLLPPPTKKKQF